MRVRDVLKTFYDTYGWQRDRVTGRYRGEVLHEDLTLAAQRYMEANEMRYRRCFAEGGSLFLDAGCGAEPRRRLAPGFGKHVCADISRVGLKEARAKLGAVGLYVVSDLATLPFRDAVFGGVLASHCLYHVDKDAQPAAVHELYRVAQPGKTVLLFYASNRNLMSGLQFGGRVLVKAARVLLRPLRRASRGPPPLYYHTHNPAWLVRGFAETSMTCLRTLTMRETRILGRLKLLNIVAPVLAFLERMFPRAMLYVGKYVAIEIRHAA